MSETYDSIIIEDLPYDCSTAYLIERIKEEESRALSFSGTKLRWSCVARSYYVDYDGALRLEFVRPYTQQELDRAAKHKRTQEELERQQYEKLKKKFENNS